MKISLAAAVTLLLAGCQSAPPIRLNPVAAHTPRPVAAARAAGPARPVAAATSCARTEARLTEQDKESMFRQFEAEQAGGGRAASARTASRQAEQCRPSS